MTDLLTTLPPFDEVRNQTDLTGRLALITGGGSGLGRAMAWGLACHGASIAIDDRDIAAAEACAKEITAGCGARTLAVRAEVHLEEDVENAIKSAGRCF